MKLAPKLNSMLLLMEQYGIEGSRVAAIKMKMALEQNAENHACLRCCHGVFAAKSRSAENGFWRMVQVGCGRFVSLDGVNGITDSIDAGVWFCSYVQSQGEDDGTGTGTTRQPLARGATGGSAPEKQRFGGEHVGRI